MSAAEPPPAGPVPDAAPAPAGHALSFRLDRGCVRARLTGVLESLEQILLMFLELAAELRRTGAMRLMLVDESQRNVPDAAQFLQLVQSVEGAGFAGVRLAYVDMRGGAIVRLQTNELIAREQGYMLKVFESESLADVWLRYGVD